LDKELELMKAERMEKINKLNILKQKLKKIGTEFERLLVTELMEISEITNEQYLIKLLQDMISKKEIYAQYFKSSNYIVFNTKKNEGSGFSEFLDEQFSDWGESEQNKIGKIE
jgi:hypothetical protein